ncbi:MAG: hypothetical protein WD738_19390, partial [Pirellulales bacterium]
MANKTSKKSAKVGRRGDEAAARRGRCEGGQPKAVAKSSARMATNAAAPVLIPGRNPQGARVGRHLFRGRFRVSVTFVVSLGNSSSRIPT